MSETAGQQALNDLEQNVTSAEDKAVLDEWQAEHDRERAEAIKGIATSPELPRMMPDGTLATPNEAAELTAQDAASVPYSNGRRS